MDKMPNEPLERLTRIVARAGGINAEDAELIGSSPFLHARIAAGIEAEKRRLAEQRSGWLAPLLVAWRAVGALAIVTIAAMLTFWLSRANESAGVSSLGSRGEDISRVVTGGTCALSSTAECAISTEEVLATMFADKGSEAPK